MVQQNNVPFSQQVDYITPAEGQFHCGSSESESLLVPWDDKPSSLKSYLQEKKAENILEGNKLWVRQFLSSIKLPLSPSFWNVLTAQIDQHLQTEARWLVYDTV